MCEHCDKKDAIEALEQWQERQNGSLQRIEEKVDRLMWVGAGAGVALTADLIARLLGA